MSKKEIPPAPWETSSPPPPPWETAREASSVSPPTAPLAASGKPAEAPASSTKKAQEGKDILAGAARYGVPIAGSFALPGATLPAMIGQAATSALGEISARQIERSGKDLSLDTAWQDLKAGGLVSAIDLSISALTKGLGAGMRRIGQKLFLPKEIPASVQITQDILQQAHEVTPLSRWQRWIGDERPFSLTFGQINAEEHRFITWVEGVARVGFTGRGKMTAFDMRNKKAIQRLFSDYIDQRMTSATDPEIGQFIQRILGPTQKTSTTPTLPYGEAFRPVEVFRKYLYAKFDEGLAQVPNNIDGTRLRSYITNRKDDFANKIYNHLRSEGLLPSIEAAETLATKQTRTTTKSTEKLAETTDITSRSGKDPSTLGAPRRNVSEKSGTKRADNEIVKETTKETLSDSTKLSEQDLSALWANLPPADVDKIIKGINSFWSDAFTPEARNANKILGKMRQQIEPEFIDTIKAIPALDDLWQTAKQFKATEAQAFDNDILIALRRQLANHPSAVASHLGNLSGDLGRTYDDLMQIKKTLYISAATPPVSESTSRLQQLKLSPDDIFQAQRGGMGTASINQMWDSSILRPLRSRFIANATENGAINAKKLLTQIEHIESRTPELLREIFGGESQVKAIKNFSTALHQMEQKTENNIFIQFKQAAALGTIGASFGLARSNSTGDDPVLSAGVGGATAIIMSPYIISQVLTKPTLVRMLTDGIQAGPRSTALAKALRKIGSMKYASYLAEEQLPLNALNSFHQNEGE